MTPATVRDPYLYHRPIAGTKKLEYEKLLRFCSNLTGKLNERGYLFAVRNKSGCPFDLAISIAL